MHKVIIRNKYAATKVNNNLKDTTICVKAEKISEKKLSSSHVFKDKDVQKSQTKVLNLARIESEYLLNCVSVYIPDQYLAI